jgi:hypothetical protein
MLIVAALPAWSNPPETAYDQYQCGLAPSGH